MAAQLSDSTIDGLADFYSAQKPGPGSSQNAVDVAAGQKIFTDGLPDKDVPACMACHGDKAQSNGPIPRLAGQQREYLEEQLTAFSSNRRANEIMHETSQHLNAGTALVGLFAGLYQRAGIETSSYAGRALFITSLADKGVSLRIVQKAVGHKSLSATNHYFSARPAEVSAAVELLR